MDHFAAQLGGGRGGGGGGGGLAIKRSYNIRSRLLVVDALEREQRERPSFFESKREYKCVRRTHALKMYSSIVTTTCTSHTNF